MKTHLLLLSLLATSLMHLTAQTTISLTFTAELNGSHFPLDSISVENLTQGGDTTLYAPDTVLVLDHGIGIEDNVNGHGNQMILFPAYPNPVTNNTIIRLRLPQEGLVTLRLYDLVGRELAMFSQTLVAGEHSFTFTPGKETSYLMVAEAAGQHQMQKLINLSPGDGNCRLSYSGHLSASFGMRQGKSAFPWVPGDDLRFVGYASVGVDTMDSNPTQSTTYTFHLQTMGLPCPGMPTIMDINGNVYNTVLIGTQCWMKENLKARNYKNGTIISNITNNSTWAGLKTGARCWYNNDSATYAASYGALYNWYAVDNYNGLCPPGWHVPSDLEWKTLEMHLGMSQAQADSTGWRGTDEGGKMKETSLAHWATPNAGATNSSGFTALPGGYSAWGFSNMTIIGQWWSSSAYSSTYAWTRFLGTLYSNSVRDPKLKYSGFSVRCIRD